MVERRLKEARLPRIKTLEEFDFGQSPRIAAPEIRELADGRYLQQAEPVVFIGDCGTGKTHLASGLCVAACRQKKRVRFTTVAGLVNELVEAQHHNQLGRVLARWARYELITLDEVGYVPLAEVGAELLFQVIADRAERTALIITTNLPFYAKPCWIGSPTALILSRPARNLIDSNGPWRKGRRRRDEEPGTDDSWPRPPLRPCAKKQRGASLPPGP